jgi:hypothetical protein
VLGLYALFLILGANAVLFGLAALVAKSLDGGQRKRRILLSIAIAALIAFGPRFPGTLSDMLYGFSTAGRTVAETVTLQEGDRVGLDFDVTSRSTPRISGYTDEPKILYRERYFRTVIVGLGIEPVDLAFEMPRRNLLDQELVFDERTPDANAVVIKVHGREKSSHYVVDVAVSRDGQLIAEYHDRYRLRWPGGPVLAFLTQASILDIIAENLYPGPQSARYAKPFTGPVHQFLSEVIQVTPATDPVPAAAPALTVKVDPNLNWWTGVRSGEAFDARHPEGCTPSDADDYRILLYSRDGITRYRNPDIKNPDTSFSGPQAAACVGNGVATLLNGYQTSHAIAVYDADLNIRCAMQFDIPEPNLRGKYHAGFAALRATASGFEIMRSWRPEEHSQPVVAYSTHVFATPDCARFMGLGPEANTRQLAEVEHSVTESLDQISANMPAYWQGVLQQQHRAWVDGTRQRCRRQPSGLQSTLDEMLIEAGESACLLQHYRQWRATLHKYAEMVSKGPELARNLAEDERQYLGRLVPTVFMDEPPAGGDSRAPQINLEVAWTETPVILSLDYGGPTYWHVYRTLDAWVMQVFLHCSRNCGSPGTPSSRYLATIGIDLPERTIFPPSDSFGGILGIQAIAVTDAPTIRIGDTKGPVLRPSTNAMSSPVRPNAGPDRYDLMVEEALRRNAKKSRPNRGE